MDKTKNKDDMLAAGKKRLERFRQKKKVTKASKSEPDTEHGSGKGAKTQVDLELIESLETSGSLHAEVSASIPASHTSESGVTGRDNIDPTVHQKLDVAGGSRSNFTEAKLPTESNEWHNLAIQFDKVGVARDVDSGKGEAQDWEFVTKHGSVESLDLRITHDQCDLQTSCIVPQSFEFEKVQVEDGQQLTGGSSDNNGSDDSRIYDIQSSRLQSNSGQDFSRASSSDHEVKHSSEPSHKIPFAGPSNLDSQKGVGEHDQVQVLSKLNIATEHTSDSRMGQCENSCKVSHTCKQIDQRQMEGEQHQRMASSCDCGSGLVNDIMECSLDSVNLEQDAEQHPSIDTLETSRDLDLQQVGISGLEICEQIDQEQTGDEQQRMATSCDSEAGLINGMMKCGLDSVNSEQAAEQHPSIDTVETSSNLELQHAGTSRLEVSPEEDQVQASNIAVELSPESLLEIEPKQSSAVPKMGPVDGISENDADTNKSGTVAGNTMPVCNVPCHTSSSMETTEATMHTLEPQFEIVHVQTQQLLEEQEDLPDAGSKHHMHVNKAGVMQQEIDVDGSLPKLDFDTTAVDRGMVSSAGGHRLEENESLNTWPIKSYEVCLDGVVEVAEARSLEEPMSEAQPVTLIPELINEQGSADGSTECHLSIQKPSVVGLGTTLGDAISSSLVLQSGNQEIVSCTELADPYKEIESDSAHISCLGNGEIGELVLSVENVLADASHVEHDAWSNFQVENVLADAPHVENDTGSNSQVENVLADPTEVVNDAMRDIQESSCELVEHRGSLPMVNEVEQTNEKLEETSNVEALEVDAAHAFGRASSVINVSHSFSEVTDNQNSMVESRKLGQSVEEANSTGEGCNPRDSETDIDKGKVGLCNVLDQADVDQTSDLKLWNSCTGSEPMRGASISTAQVSQQIISEHRASCDPTAREADEGDMEPSKMQSDSKEPSEAQPECHLVGTEYVQSDSKEPSEAQPECHLGGTECVTTSEEGMPNDHLHSYVAKIPEGMADDMTTAHEELGSEQLQINTECLNAECSEHKQAVTLGEKESTGCRNVVDFSSAKPFNQRASDNHMVQTYMVDTVADLETSKHAETAELLTKEDSKEKHRADLSGLGEDNDVLMLEYSNGKHSCAETTKMPMDLDETSDAQNQVTSPTSFPEVSQTSRSFEMPLDMERESFITMYTEHDSAKLSVPSDHLQTTLFRYEDANPTCMNNCSSSSKEAERFVGDISADLKLGNLRENAEQVKRSTSAELFTSSCNKVEYYSDTDLANRSIKGEKFESQESSSEEELDKFTTSSFVEARKPFEGDEESTEKRSKKSGGQTSAKSFSQEVGGQEMPEENMLVDRMVAVLQTPLEKKGTKIKELNLKVDEFSHLNDVTCCQAEQKLPEHGVAVTVLSVLLRRLFTIVSQRRDASIEIEQMIECLQLAGTQETGLFLPSHNWLLHECNRLIDELLQELEEKGQMQEMVGNMEALLFTKDSQIEELMEKVTELSHNVELMSFECVKAAEEKHCLNNELSKLQGMVVDVEFLSKKVEELEGLLSRRESDVKELSKKVLDMSKSFDLMSAETVKRSEEKHLLEEELNELRSSKSLLALKETEMEDLSNKVVDLSLRCEVMSAEAVEVAKGKMELEEKLKELLSVHIQMEDLTKKNLELEDLLSRRECHIEDLNLRVVELSQKYESISTEASKTIEAKSIVEEEVERLRSLNGEHEATYARLTSHASAIAHEVCTVLSESTGCCPEVMDKDVVSDLDVCATTLLAQYDAACRQIKELQKNSEAPPMPEEASAVGLELEHLKTLILLKEEESSKLHEQIHQLQQDLDKTRHQMENKSSELQQAEQKLLTVREKLSMAVSRGKGIVQQRDNLKQLLAENAAELEELRSSYKQELQLKSAALQEAESKLKLFAEAGERVEALESELSYIRNSANMLRESFLQKDAVLQKVEELLEDPSLPDKLHAKETAEKVEWLIGAYSQGHMGSNQVEVVEGHSPELPKTGKEVYELSSRDLVPYTQEIEEHSRKYEDLQRKYRSMAEQSAMLEQCLLERNYLIQKWEEVLDNINMPSSVMSKEPEDRLEWLGTAVSDSQILTAELQHELEISRETIDTLNLNLQKLEHNNHALSSELEAKDSQLKNLEEENHRFSIELVAKDSELKNLTMELEELTSRQESVWTRSTEGSIEYVEQYREVQQESSKRPQLLEQNTDIKDVVTHIHDLMGDVIEDQELDVICSADSINIVFERSVQALVEKYKLASEEAAGLSSQVTELLSHISISEKTDEDFARFEHHLQLVQEELTVKLQEIKRVTLQSEELKAMNSTLEEKSNELLQQNQKLTDELAFLRGEFTKSQLEAEEKLSSVREKLNTAVKRGKNLVQLRDNLRQSLEERNVELNQVKQESQALSLSLGEADQRIRRLMEQMEGLESELLSAKAYATDLEQSLQESNRMFQKVAAVLDKISAQGISLSGDPLEKIQWLLQAFMDAQRKVGVSEQEAKKSKKGAELLALQVEEAQERMESLNEELSHAENKLSILAEEKKTAETAKAEAGLRLEHAMAKINSLLFELTELRESKANLERENSTLKDNLSAQMEEIRQEQVKAEQQHKDSADLHMKLQNLKDKQATLLNVVAGETLRLIEDVRSTKAFAVEVSGWFSSLEKRSNLFAVTSVESHPSNWRSEFSASVRNPSKGWTQTNFVASLKLQCEEMDKELQGFGDFYRSSVTVLTQDSASVPKLLQEVCNSMYRFRQEMNLVDRGNDLASALKSYMLEKDKEALHLEGELKTFIERVKYTADEVELLKMQVQGQRPWSSSLSYRSYEGALDGVNVKDLLKFADSLAQRIDSNVKDLHSFEQSREAKLDEMISSLESKANIKICELQTGLEEAQLKITLLQSTKQELDSLQNNLSMKEQEKEDLIQALHQAEGKIGGLSTRVKELEKANQELEASLGKASSRFSATINSFNNFQRLSEKLIAEAESVHELLEARDAEMSQLRDELDTRRTEATSLQRMVDEKTLLLAQLHRRIHDVVGATNVGGRGIVSDLLFEQDVGTTQEQLDSLLTSIQSGTDNLRVQLARKDALLQDLQMRHDELAGKIISLQGALQDNQAQLQRLRVSSVSDNMGISADIDEMGNRSKHIMPVGAATHVRGTRKAPVLDHQSIDVDTEATGSSVGLNDDDKGHVFKPLTSSRLVPRGTRFLVDRIDGFWVAGDRLLMRKPGARLSVILYWVALHIWMLTLLL